jgi:SAM-dependent methyltransferase
MSDRAVNNNKKVTYWLKPSELVNSVYVHSRRFVSDFGKLVSDPIREQQIYKEHIYMEKDELLEILEISINANDFDMLGVGVELGSGCSAISVELVKLNQNIEKIYAIEIVPEIVEYAAVPLIYMHNVEEKVVPVVGSFDDIKLSDNSVDFIIEFDSLHHSFDLNRTIRESNRVLKPGSKLLAIDRAHWSTSKRRRNELENVKYSKEFLTARGLDPNIAVTRAENGEHEHLLDDYLITFKNAGFTDVRWVFLIDPKLSILKLSLISAIPSALRRHTKYHYIQTWPFRKLVLPVILMRVFKLKKVGKFISFPRNKNSNRFQAKTLIYATK